MTITVRTIFSINATDGSHDFLVIRRGPAGISIEAYSREDEWESATAGPFTPEQLRAALDEVAPAGSYTRTDESRPLTPDAITDEMVERGAVANWRGDVAHPDWTFEDISDEDRGWYRDNARAVLTAALTEPPARPEGLTRLIDTIREATYDPEPVATGEALYNAGVRVVTEEQP